MASCVVKFLNLDKIFDPDRVPGSHATSPEPAMKSADDLRPVDSINLPAEWHLEWDEIAMTLETQRGLPREQAEAVALLDVLRRMRE